MKQFYLNLTPGSLNRQSRNCQRKLKDFLKPLCTRATLTLLPGKYIFYFVFLSLPFFIITQYKFSLKSSVCVYEIVDNRTTIWSVMRCTCSTITSIKIQSTQIYDSNKDFSSILLKKNKYKILFMQT